MTLIKKEIYKIITIGGLLSFVPVVLFSGPLAGYFIGDYLAKKFGIFYFLFIMIGIGILASLVEAVRIIRFVLKIDSKREQI